MVHIVNCAGCNKKIGIITLDDVIEFWITDYECDIGTLNFINRVLNFGFASDVPLEYVTIFNSVLEQNTPLQAISFIKKTKSIIKLNLKKGVDN